MLIFFELLRHAVYIDVYINALYVPKVVIAQNDSGNRLTLPIKCFCGMYLK